MSLCEHIVTEAVITLPDPTMTDLDNLKVKILGESGQNIGGNLALEIIITPQITIPPK